MNKQEHESEELELKIDNEENNDTSKKEKEPDNTNENKTIEDLQLKLTNLQDQVLRTLAESENTRKRYEKRLEETNQYAITQFAKELLAVMDNLTLALNHTDAENFITGVKLTQEELANIFKNKGIEEIKPQVRDLFDYNLHNAISQLVTNDYPEGSIVNVMQSGYKMKDRLLRPALVVVAKNLKNGE